MADIVKLIYKGDEMAQWGGSSTTPQATTSVIWTVRGATDAEIRENTWTGSNGELLVMTPYSITKLKFADSYYLHWESWWPKYSTQISSAEQTTTLTIDNNEYIHYVPGILIVEWDEYVFNWQSQNTLTIANEENHYWYSASSFYEKVESCSVKVWSTTYYPEMKIHHRDLVYISGQGDPTFTLSNDWTDTSITWKTNRIQVTGFIEITPVV